MNPKGSFLCLMIVFLTYWFTACAPPIDANTPVPSSTKSNGLLLTQTLTKSIPPTALSSPSSTKTHPAASLQIAKANEWLLSSSRLLDIEWSIDSNKLIILPGNGIVMYDMISQKQIWDVKPLSLSHYFSGSAFSPDGKSLALYSRLDGIQIQDASVEPNITRPQESNNLGECLIVEGKGVSWLYDGKTIVVGVTDDRQEPPEFTEIQFWDVQSLQCMEIFAKVKGEFRSLDLSSDGNFIAVSTRLSLLSDSVDAIQEDGQTTVWNINTKKQICLIDGAVVSKFYPKNNLLLVFDINGGNLTYWDIVKCQPISQLINISRAYSLAFSKDGELLTVNTGKAIYLIDPLFGKVLVQLDTPLIPKDALWSLDTILSLSPNGHYLVYATVDRPMGSRIFLWKVER